MPLDTTKNALYRLAADTHAIVSITDVKGDILHANDLFCSITGYGRDELIGQNHRIIKSDEHGPEVFKSMWRDIARGQVWQGEIKNWRKRGGFYWVKTTIVPVLNPAGKPIRYVGIRTDITERKLAETRLKRSKARLKHALATKSAFLSRMSHEIRTPLNGIVGLTEVLAEMDLNEEQTEILAAITDSSDRLMHLLGNLLDIGTIGEKVTSGKVAVSQSQITAELNTRWLPIAQEKGLGFDVSFGADLPAVLNFDFGLLARVISELVKNAIAFTQTGWIGVHIRTGSDQSVVTEVSDTGEGIKAAAFERIFEPFEQGDSSITRTSDGAGLGLALCKELVERLGGDISVTSTRGKGSVFEVRLPELEG